MVFIYLFIFHICDVKILANLSPQNSKIGQNHTIKIHFPKISRISLSKKVKIRWGKKKNYQSFAISQCEVGGLGLGV
jgi:hypothetical protein